MSRLSRLGATFVAFAMLAPCSDIHAQSGANFRQTCEAQMGGEVENAQTIVTEILDRADAALARRDVVLANGHLNEAASATMGVAGWSGATSVKCLGESIYDRYYNARQRLVQLQADLEPANMIRVVQSALWVAVQDPAGGRDSVISVIPLEPRAYHDARVVCDDNVRRVAYYREIGTFVTPEEQTMADLSHELMPKIVNEMKRQATRVLADEEFAFNRPMTPQEQAGAKKLEGIGDLAEAMAGMDVDPESQAKSMVIGGQVRESRELLELARNWDFHPDGMRPGERTRADLRGEQRGDTMLARADDETLSLEVRDDFFGMAIRYYDWCLCRDKAARATGARDAIQPALQAKEARNREKMAKMQAEMEKKAENMQQAIGDMQKSEAEQQSFKDEAAELEAELDF